MYRKRTRTALGSLLLGAVAVLVPPQSLAAPCQSELRMLADDLAGIKLTSAHNQALADIILRAKRHCWVQHEEEAMKLVNRARRIAGLKETTGEFEWETVPLESLEKPLPSN